MTQMDLFSVTYEDVLKCDAVNAVKIEKPSNISVPITEDKLPKVRFFDLETQLGSTDVGGWSDESVRKMRMSIGVLYCEPENEFRVYTEDKVQELIEELFNSDVVIGFNNIWFDNTVLSAYTDRDLNSIPTIDMLADVKELLPHRLKLDQIAHACFPEGGGKSADGLMALQWWKEGKVDKIAEYCKQDVAVTRDVYKYGVENKQIKYEQKFGTKTLAVDWKIRKNGAVI